MSSKFILVRRKDNHSITAEIAEESLVVWSAQWEPVPEQSDQDAVTAESESEDDKPPRKSRKSAASTDKE